MTNECTVEDCTIPAKTRGWCHNHYMGFYMHGPCQMNGCTRPARTTGGICRSHWPIRCAVDACDRTPGEDGHCTYHRRKYRYPDRQCKLCGATYSGPGRTFCSRECRDDNRRTPLALALRCGDPSVILAAVKQGSDVTPSGCWEWRGARQAGYAVAGGAGGLVHRRVLAAVLGRSLGQHPVHHKCANRACVNPDHLELTTHRDNHAEMFARTYLERRIAELESALAEYAPEHPLLVTHKAHA